MNLSQLRYFACIGRLENYTQAAQELHVSQPSLSKAMHHLEEELHFTLFHKQGRHIVLTDTGRQLLKVVTTSLQGLDTGIAELQAAQAHQPVTVRVGCIPTVIGTYLPKVLHQFEQQRTGRVQFELHSVPSEAVQRGLKAGTFDLGIAAVDDRWPGYQYQALLKQAFIVIVAPDHPLAHRRQLTLGDLVDYPVLTYDPQLLIGQKVQRILTHAGVADALQLKAAYPDEISIAGMVQSSQAVGLVADTLYLAAFNVRKLRVAVPADLRVVSAIYRADNPHHADLQALFDLITTQSS
ncbi:LysR family transcriptional regulator [Levilactobacillus spicheri]|uniref:HTH lysR-type domain-containing protein n=1 Tax=Levilactobacillus spicheri TaxID=216463 RepID=A0A0F3RV69_9LACO|nr:LysR family transcriptional regulator [Levilactobacillus spicheri]KJW13923.1 hypothetical protein VC81_00125 [Levilactobacillus spicheri]